MISMVKCSNCDKDLSYPIGAVDAHINLGVYRRQCNACHQSVGQHTCLSFCGPGCLKEFVNSEKWTQALDELANR